MEAPRLKLVDVAPDLTDPLEMQRELLDLAARARAAGWRVNLAADLCIASSLLTFSVGREG